MRNAILDYIRIRDSFLSEFRVAIADLQTPIHEHGLLIGRLALANNIVRRFAQLTPGPTTPVLEPEEAADQLQLCDDVDSLLMQAAPYVDLATYAREVASV